jgi:cytochrome c oxidase subunit 2
MVIPMTNRKTNTTNATRRQLLGSVITGFGIWQLAQASVAKTAPAKEKVIQIQAKKFVYTPNRVMLKKGEAVVLEFTALDFMHGFKVPDWNIRADLMPGQVTRISVKPESIGEIDFLCDNFCGSGHEEMNGKFIVTE